MELISTFIDIFLHLDKHLGEVIHAYGAYTYLILFLIIFCETGLVVTPILPGDSLLFAAGAFAAAGAFHVTWLFVILSIAGILGDTVNFWIGAYLGDTINEKKRIRFINKEYLEKTHRFYEKHGGKTIIIARFMPIIRTFAPFVAGVGKMNYTRFIGYNITGGLLWIATFVFGGYFFGNIPVVKRNFTLVILAIIFISILPGIVEYWRHKQRGKDALV
jgi:membrane-associated protein